MKPTALPPFHITKTTRIVVEADHTLTTDLQAYAAFNAQTHQAKVSEADLLREMARHYMAGDAGFQAFKSKAGRKRRSANKTPEATS